MMTVDELPEHLRHLHRPGDPLPTWGHPHVVNTWGWSQAWRRHFPNYIRGHYLGFAEEVRDGEQQLAPLADFDYPNLRRRTDRINDADADYWAHRMTNKGCAGLNPELRVPGPSFRRKILDHGRLDRLEAYAFGWTLSGICFQYMYPLIAGWRLSIYELARVSALSFDGRLLAGWLNLWAEDPDKPIPEGDDLTDEERARARGYIVTPIEVFDATTLRQVYITHTDPDYEKELAALPKEELAKLPPDLLAAVRPDLLPELHPDLLHLLPQPQCT